MTNTQTFASTPLTDDNLLARLQNHRTLAQAPIEELQWLIAHGTLERYEAGFMVARNGELVDGLYVILSGHVSHRTDQGGTWRKVIDWRAGEVSGYLPYSRMTTAPGNSVVEESTEALHIRRSDIDEMIRACPRVTAALVHVMVDRARAFKTSDLQQEKMASLGKLAAGLSHELNNPASAAARSAQLITEALAESDAAARALGAAGLQQRELEAIDEVHAVCVGTPTLTVLSPMEHADREEAIADWLTEHVCDDTLAGALADTELNTAALDDLAKIVKGDKLQAALRWVAAACTVRALARDIERAASRVHALVSAVKRHTHMDQSAAPKPVDVGISLSDTLSVLGGKARRKSVAITIDAPANLPPALGFAGELNQVWSNLIDNALDAAPSEGRVTVTARAEGERVVVRVEDDGPGIPPELRGRIFDPFFTTKPVGEGTGLGLDTVRQLIARNEGSIDVDSEPGRTQFRVSLPAAR